MACSLSRRRSRIWTRFCTEDEALIDSACSVLTTGNSNTIKDGASVRSVAFYRVYVFLSA